jgi:hypothetical protein
LRGGHIRLGKASTTSLIPHNIIAVRSGLGTAPANHLSFGCNAISPRLRAATRFASPARQSSPIHSGEDLVKRLLTPEEIAMVSGANGYCQGGTDYAQWGGNYTQSGGNYFQTGGTYNMNCG